MSYSRDFGGVRIRDDGTTIVVDATSVDDKTLEPGPDDPADEIYVALMKVTDDDGDDGDRPKVLVSTPVDCPVDPGWEAVFPHGTDHFALLDWVYVIGVARTTGGAPYVWQEKHQIADKGGDPEVEGVPDEALLEGPGDGVA